MRKLPLTIRAQGGAIRQGEAIGRKGKQLLVRYYIANGYLRERWFGPDRVNHCYLEQDLEILDRYVGKTCPAVVFDNPAQWADGYPTYPKGADYGSPESDEFYAKLRVWSAEQEAIRLSAELCPKCKHKHHLTFDDDGRAFTGRKSLRLEPTKVDS